MNVQWPGHIQQRQMQEDIKLIDLIIELVDARVHSFQPKSDIDELGKKQGTSMILLNNRSCR